VSERDEVDANATKLLEQVQQSYENIVGNVATQGRTHGSAPTTDRHSVGADPRVGSAGVPSPSDLFVDRDTVDARFEQATTLAVLGVGEGAREIRSQPAVEIRGRVADWVGEIRRLRDEGETVLFVAGTAGRAERTIELLKEYDVFAVPVERAEDARYAAVLVAVGGLSRGFRLPDAGLQIYAESDVFEEERRAPERRRPATKAFLSDLRDLKVGDYVVHIDNGIGMFVGLKQIGVGDSMQEFLELRYAGEDKLFVPVERLDLVQKYTGASKPPIDRLGGVSWEKAKSKVKKAMRDMAEELLKLYAARRAVTGHAFNPDSHWQQEFEDAFEYNLTPDQKTAIADIKRDMESDRKSVV
jgi:transcription-repair coupling factor (superfamily II helicase)